MHKATSTYSKARNIAIALTMSFATVMLITACGDDESTDKAQSPAAEMSSENQYTITENNSEIILDSDDIMESEFVTDINAEVNVKDENGSNDISTVQNNDSASGEMNTHTVTAQSLIYDPLVVMISSGDSMAWRNMATHNTESLESLIPEGAKKWSSPIGKSYKRSFTQKGIYVYKCTTHFGKGRGNTNIVGDPVNLELIKIADASGAASRLLRMDVSAAESM